MVLKGFLRKKTTYIYLLIEIIILLALLFINIYIYNLNILNEEVFKDTTYLFIESKNNISKFMSKDKRINNIEQIIELGYKSNEYILETQIVNFDIYSILTFADQTGKLNEDEVIIGLSDLDFVNFQYDIDDLIGKSIPFSYKGEILDLKIKYVQNTNRFSKIFISKKLFDKLSLKMDFKFLSKIDNEKSYKSILNDYKQNVKDIFLLTSMKIKDVERRDKISKLLNNYQKFNYLVAATFILIFMIVNLSILSDLKYNVKLENNLGFSNHQIIKNIILRILLLHFLCIIISFVGLSVFSCIEENKDMIIFANKYFFFLNFVILSLDLILVFIVNIKFKYSGRR